jgi:hypothetical protein
MKENKSILSKMIYTINRILLGFFLISTLSCKSQTVHDSLVCKDYFDTQGKLYLTNCYKGYVILSSFYFK